MVSILGTFVVALTIEGSGYLPYSGNTWRMVLTRISPFSPYYSTWDIDSSDNTTQRDIGSVSITIEGVAIKLIQASSLSTCLENEYYYYFDKSTQTNYIHFPSGYSPLSSDIAYGSRTGYSNTQTLYTLPDETRLDPFLKTVPRLVKKADPIELAKMSFPSQKVVHINSSGELDKFISSPIPGEPYSLEYYDGVSRTPIYTGYIESDSYTRKESEYSLKDIRAKENIDVPRNVFSSSAYPDIDRVYISKPIPDGFGPMIIPAVPVDTNKSTGTSNYTFRCLELYTSLSLIEAQQEDETWAAVTAVSEDAPNGSFILAATDCKNSSGAIRKIRVNVVARNYTNPADMIACANEVYLALPYNSDNYDLTNWELEKAKIGGTCFLYMDKIKKLYAYIQQLQGAGINNFIYDVNNSGKRSLFVDDKDRVLDFVIPNYEIKAHSATRDFTFYATEVNVPYGPDFVTGRWDSSKNTDFEVSRLSVYKNPQAYTAPSDNAGLFYEVDADARSLAIAEKYEPRFIHTVTFQIFTKDVFNYFLFRTGTLSLADTEISEYVGIDATEFIWDAIDASEFCFCIGNATEFVYPYLKPEIGHRIYFGDRQIEVYEIHPNLSSMEMTIIGREI